MPTRQIAYPSFAVSPEQGDDVGISFLAPGSKFGNVVVILDKLGVEHLIQALTSTTAADAASKKDDSDV